MQAKSRTNTRASLIHAAERLFAEKGLGTVSIKDITLAAGARNPSAVHYHFGNLETLISEVFSQRYQQIEEERLARFATIDWSRQDLSAEKILELAVGPFFETCLEEEGRLYVRFCVQLANDPRFDVTEMVERVGMESAPIMRESLSKKLTHLNKDTIRTRLRQAFTISLILTADFAKQIETGTAQPVEEAVQEAAKCLSGFLCA